VPHFPRVERSGAEVYTTSAKEIEDDESKAGSKFSSRRQMGIDPHRHAWLNEAA